MTARVLALLAFFATASAHALSLGDLTNKEAGGGLKEALTQGAGKAMNRFNRRVPAEGPGT